MNVNVGVPRRRDPSTETVHRYTCPLCECMCGLDIHVDADNKVSLIRGAADDVWSRGYLCPKGSALGQMHHDPDRLRRPMVRDGETWREVTWDEAFARCEELIHPLLEREGIDAFTVYVGNPAGHSFDLGRYMAQLIGGGGFHHIYSSGTVDQWPKNVTSILMYGNMWLFPSPDIRRTDYFLCMGGNPHASGGSLIACPDVLGEMDAIRARGGKVVVVDPKRTKSADRADTWIAIKPGTDAAWLLAIVHELELLGAVDLGHLAGMVDGLDVALAAARDFTPESVESFTGVPAATTRQVARDIAAAEAASIYGRIGLCNQEFGTLATWLVDVVAIVSGNFDREGCLMFGNPINAPLAWLASTRHDGVPEFGRWRSRVRNAPEVLGQVPASCMAEEIATPGPGQIKGLVTVAANPVITAPDSARLDEAMSMLECCIAIDNYLNETTRHAHVILPGPSPLEAPHYDELLWGWALSSAGKWSDPVFDPPDGHVPEWEILIRLGQILAGRRNADIDVAAIDDGFFRVLCYAKGLDPDHAMAHYGCGGPERMTDWSIRVGPWGDRYGERPDGLTLDKIKAHPEGVDMGPLIPRAHEAVCTPSGHIDLAPDYIVADVDRLKAKMAAPADPLVLISRRDRRWKNSWLHNTPVLVRGKHGCTLQIHPADAERCGVADGQVAVVSSVAGSVEVPVEVTDAMMPGVVCLPNGFGHDKEGTRLSIAREHAGVNNNLLAPGEFVDQLSGNAAVNGIPVEVMAAAR